MENIFWGVPMVVILITTFFVIRGLLLWYWKINYRVELLERIDNNLEYIARLLKAEAPSNIETLIDQEIKSEIASDEQTTTPVSR